MKIAVLSDIHSNFLALKTAIVDALSRGCSMFIFCGDYITDGFMNNEVLDLVKRYGDYVIIGNREYEVLNGMYKNDISFFNFIHANNQLTEENRRYIENLPNYLEFEINGKKILLAHNTPNDFRAKIFNNSLSEFDKLIKDYNFDIYLFGHHHKNVYINYYNKHFFNVGNVGHISEHNNSYLILDIDDEIKYEYVDIKVDIDELKELFINNSFYKENYLWANLILNGYKRKENYLVRFVKLLNKINEVTGEENIEHNYYYAYELFKEIHKLENF